MSATTIAELRKEIVENKMPNVKLLPIEVAQVATLCSKSPLPMLPISVLGYRKYSLSSPLKWRVPAFCLFSPFEVDTEIKFMIAKNRYGCRLNGLSHFGSGAALEFFIRGLQMGHYATKFRGFLPKEVRDYVASKREEEGRTLLILAETEWTTRELTEYEIDPFIVSLCGSHFHIHKEFNLTSFEQAVKEEFTTAK